MNVNVNQKDLATTIGSALGWALVALTCFLMVYPILLAFWR